MTPTPDKDALIRELFADLVEAEDILARTEINPNNYDHDLVMKMNDENLEAYNFIRSAIEKAKEAGYCA